jgi:hypothetical protein
MEDVNLLIQTLLIIIAIPCLVLFYSFIGYKVLTLFIRIIKTIWNSTN